MIKGLKRMESKPIYKDIKLMESNKKVQPRWSMDESKEGSALETKRNKPVDFLDANWEIILYIMLGLTVSTGSLPPHIETFNSSHYTQRDTYELLHRKEIFDEGEERYEFNEYAPFIFNHIRLIYSIQNDDYQKSLGIEQIFVFRYIYIY